MNDGTDPQFNENWFSIALDFAFGIHDPIVKPWDAKLVGGLGGRSEDYRAMIPNGDAASASF